jgi:acetyl esterase/lipase
MHLRHHLLVFLALCPIAAAQVPTFDDVVVGQVPLDAGGTVPLYTDVYLPANVSAPTPCVVWIHGGGWATGTHDGIPSAVAALLDSGVAVASAGHRFSDQAIFPAQLHDVKGVVRHLRANAALYHIDPNRIACWGASSGGHLAALLATTGDVPALEGTSGGNTQYESRVIAAVDYFGPTDLLMANPDVVNPPGCYLDYDAPSSFMSRLIGFTGPGEGVGALRNNINNTVAPFPEKLALINLANPITHLTPNDPPIFIAHGIKDSIIPTAQSCRLHLASLAMGRDSVLKIDPAFGHGSLDCATYAATRSFLIERLTAGHSAGVAYCFGDRSSSDCPCSNFSAPTSYSGCLNSIGLAGRLRAEGRSILSNDSLVLLGSSMTNSSATYVVGTVMEASGAGTEMGDGLLCISGPFIRLATKFNVNGSSRFPDFGGTPISTALTGVAPGMTRYFQVLYRDNNLFCKLQSFNLTNGVAVTFVP